VAVAKKRKVTPKKKARAVPKKSKAAAKKAKAEGVKSPAPGRRSYYNDDMPQRYLDHYQAIYDEVEGMSTDDLKAKLVKLPTHITFAKELGICSSTVYDWRAKHPEFADAMAKAKKIQAELTILLAVNNVWNPSFSTFILKANHGMVDKITIDAEASVDLHFDSVDEEA
jgi:hypothetical protein